jgi:hypothetical protein
MNDFASRVSAYHLRSINIVKSIAKSFKSEAVSLAWNIDELTIGMKATVEFETRDLTPAM